MDRKKQSKIKNWARHHSKYVKEFLLCLEEANTRGLTKPPEPNEHAFGNYLVWLNNSTRVEICPPAFGDEIMQEPTDFNELARSHYNKLVWEGSQTPFAPVLNFVVSIVYPR